MRGNKPETACIEHESALHLKLLKSVNTTYFIYKLYIYFYLFIKCILFLYFKIFFILTYFNNSIFIEQKCILSFFKISRT